mmetsp:Transcript_22653/g.21874  ORF Transcript_22653/g.21874 Transcript_22653/m.21874 type:complete len:395 (+) Transcript_22653:137-1321(+)
MMFQILCVLSVFFVSTQAACDNQCSGHGNCMTDDVCQCYDNYGVGLSHDSGDCSDRVCPFELAWADTPDVVGNFHKYAECAGRGICDRKSGECACFDGYEGKGCQRSACPNDCSGHGTCEFIDDMAYRAVWGDFSNQYFREDPMEFPYHFWDDKKIRGCVCDPTYGEIDCSSRMCPYGNDVLDTRDNLLVSAKFQVQELIFVADDLSQGVLDFRGGYLTELLQTMTFALTFKSKLNETYTTTPIVMNPLNLPKLSNDIMLALLKLPNKVIDGVSVFSALSNQVGVTPGAAIQGLNPFHTQVMSKITFTGPAVQGPQHILTVDAVACAEGCTPRITGLPLQSRFTFPSSNATQTVLADYNSYECGRRGKCDYTTGLCGCFLGYTGENCNTLTTLV